MNPPNSRSAGRFIRGRARGGGAYRPYFYFRRNGRTIPAGGGENATGGSGDGAVGWGTGGGGALRRRGGRGRGRRAPASVALHNTSSAIDPNDSIFLRPEHYAAPEDGLTIQSYGIDTPVQCPGWRLYFPNENYQPSSDFAKRIKTIEEHFMANTHSYKWMSIQNDCHFVLKANLILRDEQVKAVWPDLLQDMQLHPLRTLATLGVAMHTLVTAAAIDASLSQQSCSVEFYAKRATRPKKIYVRAVGFKESAKIADIKTDDLDHLYCVRGTVVAMGPVDAAASWIAYKCARCQQEQAMKQTGDYGARPFSCKRDGCLFKKDFVELRSSPYTRITPKQIIRLAESSLHSLLELENEEPEYLDVELRYDLVDSVVIGQNVVVTGILKRRSLAEGAAGNAAQFYLRALSIEHAQRVGLGFSERDLEAIKMINNEPDTFKLLVHSVAPELHGHELVKAGVLLSLVGGAGSQLHDESELNVLLVGDPGIGKSHILQMCAQISQQGFLVDGKRSTASASGTTCKQLTAALQGNSCYSLDAGALMRVINGHCSIDDIDRIASQQEHLLQFIQTRMLCLPYSGLYATLQTPTSIIAAANSARGHYDQSKLLAQNIRILPALLSQFHLVFLLLDKPNRDMDASLTEHIRALHAGIKKTTTIAANYALKPKSNNSMNQSLNFDNENDETYDLRARLSLNYAEEEEIDLLPPMLTKKFIAYARQNCRPVLNAEAAEALKIFYMDMRQQRSDERGATHNISHLEGLIRLTQARARIDFATEATTAHVRDVLSIVRHSIVDTSVGDYVDMNPSTSFSLGGGGAGGRMGKSTQARKFIQMLQARSSALTRRIFDFDELKAIANQAGISGDIKNLVDVVNMQGFLLKKGPNLYEVMDN